MPVILRVRGYRIWFYQADLVEPPHVHGGKAGKEAKYWMDPSIIPILVPDLDEVREVAGKIHQAGKAWQGELFGWQAEYNPESATPPLDSRMTFTPADFGIGESGIWFFC